MVDRLVNSEVNARRVANVEQCFGKMAKPLSLFGRVLVGEGVLVKMCRKKPKQRQFFLFNDILVYGNIVISKKRYNKQRIIPLENVQLEDLDDEGAMKNGWIIKTPEKSFAVYAATPTEKREWMSHIERCVADLLEKGNKRPAKEHAAVWIPDGEAARCMACGRTQFNLVQRRHHCRACGHVICGSCSTHTYRIDTLNKKPVRVCDACFTRLTGVVNIRPVSSTNGTHTRRETLPISPPRSSFNVEDPSESSSDTDEEGTRDDSKPTFYREEVSGGFDPSEFKNLSEQMPMFSYIDEDDRLRGPFGDVQMHYWYLQAYLRPSLKIFVHYGLFGRPTTLGELMKKNGTSNPFYDGVANVRIEHTVCPKPTTPSTNTFHPFLTGYALEHVETPRLNGTPSNISATSRATLCIEVDKETTRVRANSDPEVTRQKFQFVRGCIQRQKHLQTDKLISFLELRLTAIG
ncbi:hypothetical protein RB195_001502 [Necator americanus]|uniref:FYVE zinc finger n=1 Tax=Necator americanus TaxID=51031 RepID=A0ABR1DG63_NECAM